MHGVVHKQGVCRWRDGDRWVNEIRRGLAPSDRQHTTNIKLGRRVVHEQGEQRDKTRENVVRAAQSPSQAISRESEKPRIGSQGRKIMFVVLFLFLFFLAHRF